MSISEITAAMLEVTTTRVTEPDASMLPITCSQTRRTASWSR